MSDKQKNPPQVRMSQFKAKKNDYKTNIESKSFTKNNIFSKKQQYIHDIYQVEKVKFVLEEMQKLKKKGRAEQLNKINIKKELNQFIENPMEYQLKNNDQSKKIDQVIKKNNNPKLALELKKIFGKKFVKSQQEEDQFNLNPTLKVKHQQNYEDEFEEIEDFSFNYRKNNCLLDQSMKYNEQFPTYENYRYKQDFLIKQDYFQKLDPIEKAEEMIKNSIYQTQSSNFHLDGLKFSQEQFRGAMNIDEFYKSIKKDISQSNKLSRTLKHKANMQQHQIDKSLSKIQNTLALI